MERKLKSLIENGIAFIHANAEEWRIGRTNVWLESTNHVLRVFIQEKQVRGNLDDFLALCKLQKENGGWSEHSNGEETSVRVSAFSTQMIFRANQQVQLPEFDACIRKGLRYLLDQQHEDGSWSDRHWNFIDATSVPVGTLLFSAQSEKYGNPEILKALTSGMEFISRVRDKDGLWYHKAGASPVETTAHLIQKCITYGSPHQFVDYTLTSLMDLQLADGSWDNGNVDHTCDSVRCLLFASSRSYGDMIQDRVENSVRNGMNFILDAAHDNGLGAFPDKKSMVLFTADGIDTAAKYLVYVAEKEKMISLYC